ncbi:hypothetical protein BT93_F1844 [Corymbia citriodora subsp. variegata]|nr:hypothetical protein BT93_F1844 [Corymbia citriodora subsp. variegata]
MEEVESSGSSPPSVGDRKEKKEPVRVKRETLQAVLEQCQRALESLSNGEVEEDGDGGGGGDGDGSVPEVEPGGDGLAIPRSDCEADELCDLLKSRVECPDFLEKLESAQVSIPCNAAEEGGTWDIVSEDDLWEDENLDPSEQDYVVVRQEDIVEGMASFMAAYLLSLKQTKLFARHSR